MRVSQLARGFTSFWNDVVPFCDVLVADVNKYFAVDFDTVIESSTERNRTALVNEVGFELYRTALDRKTDVASVVRDRLRLKQAIDSVRDTLSRFAKEMPPPCNTNELHEAVEIGRRLEDFFTRRQKRAKPKLRVPMPGCGWLEACELDAWLNGTLFEIKAGDRGFLGTDIRQVLVYCALSSESRTLEIENVCLVNPRRGMYYGITVEELCIRIAGARRFEVTNAIINLVAESGGY